MESVTAGGGGITGVGLVTPLGNTTAETWQSLLEGRVITNHWRSPDPPGESRVVSLAVAAARQAIEQAGWDSATLRDTALVVGTSKGAIVDWLTHGPGLMGLSEIAAQVADRLGSIGGPRLTISAACASGLLALIRGAMLLQNGDAHRVLVVAAEASVDPLFVASFQRLGVLAPDGYGCRPFDRRRRGFILSEAAAAVCLESAGRVRGSSPIRITNWSTGCDASSLTGIDTGARALRRVIGDVLSAGSVDLIQAHATGTELNDPVELSALDSCVQNLPRETPRELPLVYSHKGALGHSLGALGLISVVLNSLCHQHGIIPGNVQTAHPLSATNLTIHREPKRRTIHRSLTIASGFGGPIAAMRMETV